jgi:deoxycytidylate deaminase
MYLFSERIKGQYNEKSGETRKMYGPCMICAKMIINSGLVAVHMKEEGVGTKTYTVDGLKQVLREQEELLKRSFKKPQG